MAFPVVQSVTPSAFGTAASSWAVPMPATVNAGDLLLIAVAYGSGANGLPQTPSGWTLLRSTTGEGQGILQIWGTDAAGSEGGTTVTITLQAGGSAKAAALVYRVTGWAGTLSTDVGVTGPSFGTAGPNAINPTNTPAWGALDTLWIAFGSMNASTTISVYPTNYTNTQVQASGGSGSAATKATIGSAERQLNATSDTPSGFTFGASGNWGASTVAVKPGTSGAVLAGTAAGTSAAAAALSTGIPLAASSAAGASTAAALTTGIPLAAVVVGQSAAAATTLLGAAAVLEGTAAANTSTTAALSTGIPLAGTVAAGASTTADLTQGGAAALAAVAAGQSATVAALSTGIPLAAVAAGQSLIPNAQIATAIQLIASAGAQSAAGGTLLTAIVLGGAAQASLATSVTLSTTILLLGSVTAQSTTAADLATGAAVGRGSVLGADSRRGLAVQSDSLLAGADGSDALLASVLATDGRRGSATSAESEQGSAIGSDA